MHSSIAKIHKRHLKINNHLTGLMLETPEERVELLKAGNCGKTIEQLYLKYNNFKIVRFHVLFEFIENNSDTGNKIARRKV